MIRYDRRIRKYFTDKIFTAIIVLFFIVNLVGCDTNNIEEPEVITAKVAGKISEDSNSGTIKLSDFSHITVKLIQFKANGNEEVVSSNDAVTDSQGKFVLETNIENVANLLVKAEKDNLEWKGIVSSTVKSGIAVYLQPLNPVTTISAELYKLIFIADSSLGYYRIGIMVDEEIASALNKNKEFINRVADVLKAEFDAERRIFLRPEIGGTTSQWNQIMKAGIVAQSALDRDLYFADSDGASELAYKNYLNSISDSYIDSGLQPVTYSKMLEASVRVLLNKIKTIDSGISSDFIKRSSEIRARILNIAIQHEFQTLEPDPSLINKVIYFGDELENSINDSHSQDEIQNAFIEYEVHQIQNLITVLGITGESIPELQDSILVYKNELKSDAESIDEDAIIDSYIKFYKNISNLVERQINSENVNQSTITDVLILLNMYY